MLSFLVTLFLFASMEVFSKPLMGSVDPLVLTFWRFVCGAGVLAVVAAMRRSRVFPGGRDLLLLAVMGVLNTFLSMSLLQMAVKHTAASRAATIFCSNPVFVVVIASLLGWEIMSRKRIAGLILGVAGLVLVTGVHRMTVDAGTVYALLASVTFAVYVLVGRKASLKTDPVTVNLVSFTFGIAALFLWLTVNGVNLDPRPLYDHLPWFLFLGIGVSGIGYITFMQAIRKYGAGTASTVFLLKPAVATVLAMILIGEEPSLPFAAGLVLSIAGSSLVAERNRA